MTESMLIQKWLWMQTMNFALREVVNKNKRNVYPNDKEHEWRYVGWNEMQRNIFQYALEHWEDLGADHHGNRSGDSRYDVGWDLQASPKGCTGEYKHFNIEIKWSEVKAFIKELLDEEKYHQMDLLEILAMEASRR